MLPQTMFGRLFQSFGAKLEKDLPPAVDFDILGIINHFNFLRWKNAVLQILGT